MNQLVELPVDLSSLALKVGDNKREEVVTVLNQIFAGTDDWEKQVDNIVIESVEDTPNIQKADLARKNAKNARINAEKIFDSKREAVQMLKAEFDVEDKLWLKAKQIMQLKFKCIEEKAEYKANFAKRYFAEQKEIVTQKRIAQVALYAEVNRMDFQDMSDEAFETFLFGLKATHDAKVEQARILAEQEALRQKQMEEERELQRIENERLKAEAEQREWNLKVEREKAKAEAEERERVLAEERRIAREEAEKAQEAIRKAEEEKRAIQAKLDAEKKRIEDAEKEAERVRVEAERLAKLEAEKLAKAPIKKQLANWVDSFEISEFIGNDVADEITMKFHSFKNWAKELIKTI
jgi:hypothetical protein